MVTDTNSETEYKYDVFISYSSKDRKVVRKVAERLKKEGLRVWFDAWTLKPGDSVPSKIEEGLESSRILVLCMSANAFGSDWAQLESGTFRFRDPLNKNRRLIPLRLDDAPIKGSLAQFRYITWHPDDRKQSYEKLLEACRLGVKPKVAHGKAPGKHSAEKAIQLDYKDVQITAYSFSPDGKRALTGGDDHTVRMWNLKTGNCLRVLEGHISSVHGVTWSGNQGRALSVSHDRTMRLWDLKSGHCVRAFDGHTDGVSGVAWSADQRRALSGGHDRTVRLWDMETGRCLRVFEGHTSSIYCIAWSADERRAISSSYDETVRLWEVETGRCIRVLEGHTNKIETVVWCGDQRRALSGGYDDMVRLWDVVTGRCLRVLKGHTRGIMCVASNADGRYALSSGHDTTVRLWDVATGKCLCVLEGHTRSIKEVAWSDDGRRAISGDQGGGIRVWDLSEFVGKKRAAKVSVPEVSSAPEQVQYTNAKVLLVGNSGAGKTGLTERLALDTFTPSFSTSGTWSTQWGMKDLPPKPGWEREVWLWDFGGQADQRLIHQLYMDNAALILLVFDADQELVLPGLREWQQALSRCVPEATRTFLVAGRTDVGFRFDHKKVRAFAKDHGYEYFETSASNGRGCPKLRKAVQTGIPWTKLVKRTSPAVWKLLNNEILKLRDEGHVLFTFKELHATLRQRLSVDDKFTDSELETVISLLDGPGVVKELGFGTYILLRPEWINAYAQAVIRKLRADAKDLGCLPVQSIAEGKLIFQMKQADGETVEAKRLKPREERIVLQAMERTLVERYLCLRQDGTLVFPSYCGIEKPMGPVPPDYFISYVFGGFLDDIYATLVVKLVYCGAFKLKEMWRDAADFETLADQHAMGIKLLRDDDGRGTLLVHFSQQVAPQEQVIFANYIHEHLLDKATDPQRIRHFVCPKCATPVANREIAMRKLRESGKKARIICVNCEKYMKLWDKLEERFASDETKQQVALLESQERIELDSRRKGKLLVLEVQSRITSADQKCFEIPATEDEGLDLEVEFTDDGGAGTGKRLYLQLKSGNSHLRLRKRDGAEIFRIKKQSWVKYWMKQQHPVMLVIGTFAEDEERFAAKDKLEFDRVRWMEISSYLKRESQDGTKPVKQIVFEGERLDMTSVHRWRTEALKQDK